MPVTLVLIKFASSMIWILHFSWSIEPLHQDRLRPSMYYASALFSCKTLLHALSLLYRVFIKNSISPPLLFRIQQFTVFYIVHFAIRIWGISPILFRFFALFSDCYKLISVMVCKHCIKYIVKILSFCVLCSKKRWKVLLSMAFRCVKIMLISHKHIENRHPPQG